MLSSSIHTFPSAYPIQGGRGAWGISNLSWNKRQGPGQVPAPVKNLIQRDRKSIKTHSHTYSNFTFTIQPNKSEDMERTYGATERTRKTSAGEFKSRTSLLIFKYKI